MINIATILGINPVSWSSRIVFITSFFLRYKTENTAKIARLIRRINAGIKLSITATYETDGLMSMARCEKIMAAKLIDSIRMNQKK